MEQSLDAQLDIGRYARMLWRRRGVIALSTLVVFCSALIGLEFVPEEYESSVTLKVENRGRMTRDLERQILEQPGAIRGGSRVDAERLSQIAGLVNSQPFLAQVVDVLNIQQDPAVLEEARAIFEKQPALSLEEWAARVAVGKLRSKLQFSIVGSGQYQITVTDHKPYLAQSLAEWISTIYVDQSVQRTLDELRLAHEFGEEQRRIYEDQLQESERAMERYKELMIEEDLEQGVVGAQNIGVAEALYQRVLDEAELARLRVLPHLRALSGTELDSEWNLILVDPRVQNQGRGIANALQEDLSNRLLGSRPEVGEWPPSGGSYVTLRRGLIQLIERTVAGVHPNASPQLRESLERHVFATLDYEAYSQAAEFLGQAISDFKRESIAEPGEQSELHALEEEVEKNRRLLRSFEDQLIASDISQKVEMTNLGLRISVQNPPQVPFEPSRPNRSKILLAAFFMGPVLGVGLAFMSELLDPTLRSLADFKRVFEGPILGTAPLLDRMAHARGRSLRRYWVPAAMTGVLLLTVLFFLARDSILQGVVQ